MGSYLGIEFGSTRIKAVAIDGQYRPVSSGEFTWGAKYENGVWTYDLSLATEGLRAVLSQIEGIKTVEAVGISGMMHGYLAFDKDWNLLTPFRTWQNTITAQAAKELTELFGFNVPQRWSIAHLYQAVLNREEHIPQVAHITTLAGYMHYLLTGVNAVGVGEASGIFPIDSENLCYDEEMMRKLEKRLEGENLPWNVRDVLPRVLAAGEPAGELTAAGAQLCGGRLAVGTPFAPPEGDAGTGMVATNAVAPRTGNISAGTSIFSMVVLEHDLQHVYEEIDMVTTPAGRPVAMVHCNNCTADSNAWVSVLGEAARLFGAAPTDGELFTALYKKSLEGEADCGGVLTCNYLAGEGITHLDAGRAMVVRRPEARFTLANFLRSMLYATMATLRLGMDILDAENVTVDTLTGHGGLFKTPGVAQRYMAAACNTAVSCMETAGEGGPYGMALLAAYRANKCEGESLDRYLEDRVFRNVCRTVLKPTQEDLDGFAAYMEDYKKLLRVENTAVSVL
ncbi:MAG: ATPase [Oscillospiraceae bacterium]|nr:ATPase [Oscillospiraceae bacterium]